MLLDGLTQIFLKILSDTSDNEYHFDKLLPLHMRLNIKLRAPSKVKGYIDAWNEEINYIQSVFDNMTNKKSEPPIRTNADRLNAMTVEEKAEFINDVECGLIERPGTCDMSKEYCLNNLNNCKNCWLDWLKQEVDSED